MVLLDVLSLPSIRRVSRVAYVITLWIPSMKTECNQNDLYNKWKDSLGRGSRGEQTNGNKTEKDI